MKELRAAVLASPPAAAADEDAVREFYLKTISLFVNQGGDSISFLHPKSGPKSPFAKNICMNILLLVAFHFLSVHFLIRF